MLEHTRMAEMRRKHPDWIWNRSDTHVFLGVPGSSEAFKTPVEPGNSFSPGVGTCGVSTWVFVEGALHAPEEKPLADLTWQFLDARIPVLLSSWQAGSVSVRSQLFTDGDEARSDIKDYLTVELENPTSDSIELSFYLVIRSFGAAGGPIRSLSWQDGNLSLNGAPVIYPTQPPTQFGALSYASSESDISVRLRQGKLPAAQQVTDDTTWASGVLAYNLTLEPAQSKRLEFAFHLHANHPHLTWLKPLEQPLNIQQRQQAFADHWQRQLGITLNVPDKRFVEAFYAQLAQLYMYTVADEPRITPVSYPLWWLRDGVYVVNALNKGGFHDFAERACRKVAHKDAYGGFGAEGDGPAQSIWMLSEHYLLTRSLDYLQEIYPHIERKAELIRTMLQTEVPVKQHVEFRTPACMLRPDSDLMCRPAEDGLINGRMDHHFPLLWINGFAFLGLTRAAMCATALGIDGSRFEEDAGRLRETLIRKSPDLFGKNDRDPNSALWPTGWASKEDPVIRQRFDEFWNTVRCPQGQHTPEPLWTYFEAGQAHNYILLGQRERAWVSIEHFLTAHIAPGLYTYSEGNGDENSSLLWQRTRGWDQIRYVTPHGWTAAELFLLLRDCLLREEENRLVVGSGVPATWKDKEFEVSNMPTYFGPVSLRYSPTDRELVVSGSNTLPERVISDLPFPVAVRRE